MSSGCREGLRCRTLIVMAYRLGFKGLGLGLREGLGCRALASKTHRNLCGLNCIRVWGGCIFSRGWVYHLGLRG